MFEAKMKKDDDIVIDSNGGTDTYIFDPFNPINKEINVVEVERILKQYNVQLPTHNFNLYKRAFVHQSYIRRPSLLNKMNNVFIKSKPDNCYPLYTKSNERLEFLGDGVLECIAKFYLYKRFPKADEGFMTDTKIELVKNETIGRIAIEMGLHEWFMISKHTEQKGLRQNHKKLGCLFEAFVGALFLDFNRVVIQDEDHLFDIFFQCGPGFQVAQLFVENVFDKHIDWTRITKQSDNFKRPLQELLQSEFKTTPHLMEIDVHNTEHGYHMGVYLCLGQPTHGVSHEQTMKFSTFSKFSDIHYHMAKYQKIYLFLGEGVHKIKQQAEQAACKSAIQNLKLYTDFQDCISKVQQKHYAFD
jgi:dsRNA-specific ribonuclease